MSTTGIAVGRQPSTAYKIAWCVALAFYFFEYVVRAAPAVMQPELQSLFKLDAVGVSSIVGSYYFTYSISSLVAGAALDRYGAKVPVPIGAALLGIGCMVFVLPSTVSGEFGRLLQGAGSAFAFTGAVFLAAHAFSGAALATAVGFTQCFGMLGGSVGQIGVGPLIHGALDWRSFWVIVGAACMVVAALLLLLTPNEGGGGAGSKNVLKPFAVVFRNPQSYLCGLVAGLLFAPTTVGDMIWGVVAYQQERGFAYDNAVGVISMLPLGWAVGCPALGWLADASGRRKLALMAGAALMLAGLAATAVSAGTGVNYVAMFLVGVGSGAAMIPYTIIKEVNPDDVKGSAIGVINFLTFSVTAIIAPTFAHLIGAGIAASRDHVEHFRYGVSFWIGSVVLGMLIATMLKETGSRRAEPLPPSTASGG